VIDYYQCPDPQLRFTGTYAREQMNNILQSVGRLSKKVDASRGAIYSAFKSKKRAVYVTSCQYVLMNSKVATVGFTAVNVRVGEEHYRVILDYHNQAAKTDRMPKPAAQHRTRRDAMHFLDPSAAAVVIRSNDTGDGEDLYQNEEPYMNESPYGVRIVAP
jgi:hypothetical protein